MKIKAQIDRMVGENNRIKAYASVILGGEYVVRDIVSHGQQKRTVRPECHIAAIRIGTAI